MASFNAATNAFYERNTPNNLSLGPAFEANVAIYSLLALKDDQQELAFEYKGAPAKFDDVVLRVQRSNCQEYYYRQLKHKDTEQEPNAYLTWNELLKSKKVANDKAPYGIPSYFECLMKQTSIKALKDVKELAFVTNCKLVMKGSTGLADLEELAQRLLYPTGTDNKKKLYITEDDMKQYFQECTDDPSVWRPPTQEQKSYKFTEEAITAIFEGTKAGFLAAGKTFGTSGAASFDAEFQLYKTFLELLVFRVAMPHVNKLKEVNQQFLKVFLPFYKNALGDHYEQIKQEFMQVFMPVQSSATGQQCTAAWATVEQRQSVFKRLSSYLKTKVSIGSRENYEMGVLTPIYRQLYSGQCHDGDSPWTSVFNEMSEANFTWADRKPLPLVNLYNDDSNATVATLNILSYLTNSERIQAHAWRTFIVQLEETTGMTNFVEYFKKLKEEASKYKEFISTSFCCVVQVSPSFHPADKVNGYVEEMVRDLNDMPEVRKWIKFVVVTQSPITSEGELERLERVECSSLKWDELSEDGRKHLINKTLYLNEGRKTSLQMLGFKEETVGEWLQPKSLAELIIHDRERPLTLGLPNKHPDLGTDYVEREIQVPILENEMMPEIKENFSYEEQGCEEAKYQLLTVAGSDRRNVYLAEKSNVNASILDVEYCITRSKDSEVTVHESHLFKDNVNFGTGSRDNKLLVVVDYPGKGKTWLLNNLSNQFLDSWTNELHHFLLLRVNLREIKDWQYSDSPIEFLLHHSLPSGDSATKANDLDIAIVKEKILNASEPCVFVLLDGYDEISDEQRRVTLNVTEYLKDEAKGVKRIILTSRPEGRLENELEEHFQQFSLHLKNFSEEEQISYLTKRWTVELDRRKQFGEKRAMVNVFARQLVEFAADALQDESTTFLDIPLQCWIFSECFFKELLEFLSTDAPKPVFHEASFELLNLYNRFYDVKIDVLLEEKAGLLEKNDLFCYLKKELKKTFLNSLMRLSIFYMIQEGDAQLISCLRSDVYRSEFDNDGDEMNERNYSSDLKRATKLGYIKCSDENSLSSHLAPQDVKFLHRTFAEYFFAFDLLRNFTAPKSELLDGVRGRRFSTRV